MATPIDSLEAMKSLAPNWDGYNADPPDPAVLELAKDFVRLLVAGRSCDDPYEGIFVYPGRAGGVQVEWSDARFEHELEIEPDGSWGFLHIDRATGEMTERDFAPAQHAVPPGLLKEISEFMAA